MKVSDLAIPTTTRMQVLDAEGNETDVFIVGHTPDSKQYRQAQAQVLKSNKQRVNFDKEGNRYVETTVDAKDHSRRIMLMASIVTDIEGLEDWEFSYENVLSLFSNDGCLYIVEQWQKHIDDRKNFMKASSPTASAGSRSLRGKAPEKDAA